MGKTNSLLLISAFLLFCLVMPTSAGTITASSSLEIDAGQKVTVPVTISDAEDILGFKVYVWNNVPGTEITVNSSRPLNTIPGSSYDVNSAESRDYQVISWTTSDLHGISGDAVLFSIDIHSSTSSPETIPVTVEVLPEMYDSEFSEVSSSYTVQQGEISVQGTKQQTDSPVYNPSNTPVVTPLDEPSDNVDNTEEPIDSVSSVPEVIPPVESQTTAEQTISPLSILSCLGVSIAFGAMIRKERK